MIDSTILNSVGIVVFLGDLGPDPATPTYKYNGEIRGFPPGTSVEEAVQKMCQEFGLSYEAVIDKYYGLDYNQKIAKVVSDKLKSAGFTQEIRESIQANYVSVLAQVHGDLPDGTIASDVMQKRRAEATALFTVLENAKKEAYQEYPA